MTEDVAIIIPVLGRPHQVRRVIADVAAGCVGVRYRLLFVASPDDDDELAELEAAGADYVCTKTRIWRGDYPAKINLGLAVTDAPWIFTGADDLHFHPGWWAAAMAHDDMIVGVIGTNDLGNARVLAGKHATHSLVRRSYCYDFGTVTETGVVYHPGYWHEFCDDELAQTAQARGMWAFARDSIVEHLHPHWGKGETDELYEGNEIRLTQGRLVYNKRRTRWETIRASRP